MRFTTTTTTPTLTGNVVTEHSQAHLPSSPSKTYHFLSSFPCFATFAILPSGKSDVENSEIVVNKGNVEYLDFSFASGKMAKVAKHDA